ncbi:ATP-dependent DNA helicase PcrA [Clostridium acetireducens DSM 10703]|uniref:DNA 3'-5' helicase n=1 Tax=Clostridium acetireducens DSM 10703 TaxID=1121290 RepID=A0A1E8F1E5_9CLOT|nr:ATP-dependent helicase [Clostridium acetireducens]OFI07004.1 ATP-dependent DNA helicase PcrA [Clostridium acetireducens DSM 10703]
MGFRVDQKPVMEYSEGIMAVPAVPGAGKTFIVANLAAKIIKEKLKKREKVLIVTYMNSAVNNFKNRIKCVLEEQDIKDINSYEVMTIHSLALRILKDRPDVVNVNENFKILDEAQKSVYLNECIKSWRKFKGERIFKNVLNENGLKSYNNKQERYWNNFLTIVTALISELKLNDIQAENLDNKLKIFNNKFSVIRDISDIYKNYTKRLKLDGYLDYDDILILAYKALKRDKKLREKFQKKYTYIFEDECQDSNIVQYKILTMLSEKSGNLVRVGDINQSIMATFTPSDPKFFKEFCSKADKKYTMYMAGRSSKKIIDLANYLVEFIINNHYQKQCREALQNQKIQEVKGIEGLKNPSNDESNLYAFLLPSWDKEIEKVIESIKIFKKKHPNETIGVLITSNYKINKFVEKLDKENIDYDNLSSISKDKVKIVNIIGYLLKFLAEPDSSIKFKIFLDVFIDDKYDKKDLILQFIDNYKNPYDIIYRDFEKIKSNNNIVLLIKIIENIRKIFEYYYISIDNLIIFIGSIFDFNIQDKALIQAVALYVKNILREEKNVVLNDIADRLIDKNNPIFVHIGEIIYEMEGYEPSPEKVTIATYHKAKGLEWDCVFLMDNTEYNFPYTLKDKIQSDYWYIKEEIKNPVALGKAEIEKLKGNIVSVNPLIKSRIDVINEKVRLLYVGITRAKKYLILTANFNKNSNSFKTQSCSRYFQVLKNFINSKEV